MPSGARNSLCTRREFLRASAGVLAGGILLPGIHAKTPAPAQISLGKTGLLCTPLGYGASRTREPALIRAALAHGMNFFDTGRNYLMGQNEVMVGEILKGMRQDVVIQSKFDLRIRERGEALQAPDVGRRIKAQIETSLDASLQALQTDYIDTFIYHQAGSEDLLFHEAVLETLDAARRAGKIRAAGFSAHNEDMHLLERTLRQPFYDVVMIPYNHRGAYVHSQTGRSSQWDQPALEDLLVALHAGGVGVIAMKTCSGGPYSLNPGQPPSYRDALKWVMDREFVDCTATAMLTFEEITENAASLSM